MRISLNLASRPYADFGPVLKRLRIAMGALAGIALLLLLGLHFVHQKAEAARARARALDAKIALVEKERQGYQQLMQQPANALLLGQVGILNQLFDEKTFSWTLAMEDLETVLPGGVQVTTLEPTRSEKDGHITVKLRVVGPRDRVVELVKNLEHSRHFVLPSIVGETSESNTAPGARLEPVSASSPANFDLLAEYRPAAPSEHKADKKQVEAPEEKLQPTPARMPAKAAATPQPVLPQAAPRLPAAPVHAFGPAMRPPMNGQSRPPGPPAGRPQAPPRNGDAR